MSATSKVEAALTVYVKTLGPRGADRRGFRAEVLADIAGISTVEMSDALQEYRQKKRKGFALGCQGYGRAARWFVLAKPNTDPRVVQRARREHLRYTAEDAVARFVQDQRLEVDPSLKNTPLDQCITSAQSDLTRQFQAAVESLAILLELSEEAAEVAA